MYDSIPAPEATIAPDETGARARMGLLRTLSEIGVRIAERMDRQSELSAIYAETCAVPEHLHAPYARRIDEIGRAFAQVCRAVTLAVAVEERIETDLLAGPAARAEQALKRRLLAARAGTAEAREPAEALAPAAAQPAPETSRAPDVRLRLDRALDPGLAALDAALDRDPDQIIAEVRRTLDRAEDGTPWDSREPVCLQNTAGPAAVARGPRDGPPAAVGRATHAAVAPRTPPRTAPP
jgi:hypothetical protein